MASLIQSSSINTYEQIKHCRGNNFVLRVAKYLWKLQGKFIEAEKEEDRRESVADVS